MEKQVFSNWYEEVFIPYIEGEEGFEDVDPVGVNFGVDHPQVNPYWIEDHWEGDAQSFLMELKDAMMTGNHDRSDIQTDLVDVGWYIEINIGRNSSKYHVTD